MRKSKKRGKFKVDPDAKYRSRVSKAEKAHDHRNAQARYYARNAHTIRDKRRRQAAEKKEKKRAAKQQRRTTQRSSPPPALAASESSLDQHARSSGAIPQDDSDTRLSFSMIPKYVGVDCGSSDSQPSFEASFWDPRAFSVVNRFNFSSVKPSEESIFAGKSLNSDELLATRALAELGRGGQIDSQSKVSHCSSTTAIQAARAHVAELNSSPLTPPTKTQVAKWRQSVVVGGRDNDRLPYLLRWRDAVAAADSGSHAG
ncbi:hypothetical protein FB45DRAFT_868412 [Roridomyces roridus]|uniref:Uncharacterized protein n=1 Tax=Roridomyces roridus TaxID=1738132 RepID=A0AAD7BPT3_9AGAR|nr:hypothetical protein FB45DRAFT_868412 [Roridomyces roridus]